MASGKTPSGASVGFWVRTDAVGQRSRARQAMRNSSGVSGCLAKTDWPSFSTISPGATVRAAVQSVQRVSIYQLPGAFAGWRSLMLANIGACGQTRNARGENTLARFVPG